jgi:hypothetical protein
MFRSPALFSVFLICTIAAALFVSCGSEGIDGVSMTLTFLDSYTGDPIPGIDMYLNGDLVSSDDNGTISMSTDAQSLEIEGYIDCARMYARGYHLDNRWAYLYFSFTARGNYSRTIHLDQLPGSPTGIPISGWVFTKDGGAKIQNGSVDVYAPDGRKITGRIELDPDDSGWYSSMVSEEGSYYFIVNDYDTDEVYYTVRQVTTESADGLSYTPEAAIWTGDMDLSYDGNDISIQGDAGDAQEIYGHLVLGEEIVGLNGMDDFKNLYTITTPHRSTDRIRIMSVKETEDFNHYFCLCPSPGYSESAGNVALTFSSQSTVPPDWDAGMQWDEESQTLSWNAAGNATAYGVYAYIGGTLKKLDSAGSHSGLRALVNDEIFAFVETTSVQFPENIDLSSLSYIQVYPIWTESFVGIMNNYREISLLLLPADAVSGTAIFYEGLTQTLKIGQIVKKKEKEIEK